MRQPKRAKPELTDDERATFRQAQVDAQGLLDELDRNEVLRLSNRLSDELGGTDGMTALVALAITMGAGVGKVLRRGDAPSLMKALFLISHRAHDQYTGAAGTNGMWKH
jgi:hypothetical protein